MDEEQKKHSEEEVESSEAGTGNKHEDISNKAKARSYECMFCKRGFTTAQALGGHMNIHRRDRPDRVSKSFSSSSSKRAVDISCGPYSPYHAHKRSGSKSNTGSGASSAPVSGFYANTHRVASGSVNLSNVSSTRELSLLKNDDDGLMVPGNDDEEGEAEGDDLDLELRLGHSHSL